MTTRMVGFRWWKAHASVVVRVGSRGGVVFDDRRAGADALVVLLREWFQTSGEQQPPILLGLPRGGVPVAARISELVGWPWDVLIVRKIGAPNQPELAVGAVGEGGVEIRNRTTQGLFDESAIARIARAEHQRVEQRVALLRNGHAMLDIRDRTVILIDDGLATGTTMVAAITVAREHGARRVVVGVPVASAQALEWAGQVADEVICAAIPDTFMSVGQHYSDFSQVSDDDVVSLLAARD